MSTAIDNVDPTERTETIEISKGWFVALGVFLILTGTGALVFPMVATLSIEILTGLTLVTAGFLTFVHAFSARRWRGFAIELVLALLYMAGGAFFLIDPLAGMLTLTIMLGAFFAADGVTRVMLAFRIKPDRAWVFFLGTGLLSALLGALVLLGLPSGFSLAFLGIIVGINLILTGISFLFCTVRVDDAEPSSLGSAPTS
ncbi:MAG: DUF308 domain-containing protein [Pseudomonadota bacterium]